MVPVVRFHPVATISNPRAKTLGFFIDFPLDCHTVLLMNHQEKIAEISALLVKGNWTEAMQVLNKVDHADRSRVIRELRHLGQVLDSFVYEAKNL